MHVFDLQYIDLESRNIKFDIFNTKCISLWSQRKTCLTNRNLPTCCLFAHLHSVHSFKTIAILRIFTTTISNSKPGYHFPSLQYIPGYEYPFAFYPYSYQLKVSQYPSYSMTQHYLAHSHHLYQTMDYSPHTTYSRTLSQYQHQQTTDDVMPAREPSSQKAGELAEDISLTEDQIVTTTPTWASDPWNQIEKAIKWKSPFLPTYPKTRECNDMNNVCIVFNNTMNVSISFCKMNVIY